MKHNYNHFSESDKDGKISECFIEELTDEIKVISYLISAVGDSVGATGIPSDPMVLNQALAQLSFKLDNVAEVLENVQDDLTDEDSKAADQILMVLKQPGAEPVLIMAEESPKVLQSIIGDYIEIRPVTDTVSVVASESGAVNHMPKNCTINGHTYYGTLAFIGTDNTEEISELIEE